MVNWTVIPNPIEKGDIISAIATSSPSYLSVGSNGEFLVPNSSASIGLEWVSIACYEDLVVSHQDAVVYN